MPPFLPWSGGRTSLFRPPTSHVRDYLGGMEEDEWSFPSSSSRGGKASMKLGKKLSDSIGEVEED
eukprot:CAMPEP_0183290526 /NCGR_PEP_ID=MMETSP0160_2-20130417/164_1 /TAXON_ID=2839 ORGANISM="Odontella Sinensis, Strain Grunow 1884" /NCGR_SAMPLE_ID=MMETSP0160_2 /ASSEMBLY_ACC=CAM_ASM_000250 /LENGTH=64 /DNA_ID=CAMNT_0025451147 /DNA_START=1 /DNA_END=192 /DNA_ORIENTATION=+